MFTFLRTTEFSELELLISEPLLFWIGSENPNVISEYVAISIEPLSGFEDIKNGTS